MIIGCRNERTEYMCIDCDCESKEECEEFMKAAGMKENIEE